VFNLPDKYACNLFSSSLHFPVLKQCSGFAQNPTTSIVQVECRD